MKNNNFTYAMRLLITRILRINPIYYFLVAVFLAFGVLSATLRELPGTEDYAISVMTGGFGLGTAGSLWQIFVCDICAYKYARCSPLYKTIYTLCIPLTSAIVMLLLNIGFAALNFITADCGIISSDTLGDILIVDSIFSALAMIFSIFMNLSMPIICFIFGFFTTINMFVPNLLTNGFGLELASSAIAAAVIFVIGFILSLLIAHIMYKKRSINSRLLTASNNLSPD